jgi:GNAT superfamily N-acetyltransferase
MIEVRVASASDVPAVTALVAEVLGEFGLEFGQGSPTDAELYDLPDSYAVNGGSFWVAVRDGELLGTCGMFPVAPGTYELRKMYLRGASRGLGIGKQLLGVAIEWTRAQGATRIVLDTTDQMKQAIAFYEAHGFVRDDSQKRATRCTRGYVRVLE